MLSDGSLACSVAVFCLQVAHPNSFDVRKKNYILFVTKKDKSTFYPFGWSWLELWNVSQCPRFVHNVQDVNDFSWCVTWSQNRNPKNYTSSKVGELNIVPGTNKNWHLIGVCLLRHRGVSPKFVTGVSPDPSTEIFFVGYNKGLVIFVTCK